MHSVFSLVESQGNAQQVEQLQREDPFRSVWKRTWDLEEEEGEELTKGRSKPSPFLERQSRSSKNVQRAAGLSGHLHQPARTQVRRGTTGSPTPW